MALNPRPEMLFWRMSVGLALPVTMTPTLVIAVKVFAVIVAELDERKIPVSVATIVLLAIVASTTKRPKLMAFPCAAER